MDAGLLLARKTVSDDDPDLLDRYRLESCAEITSSEDTANSKPQSLSSQSLVS